MRILITGGSGLLGWNLAKAAASLHEVIITYFHHPIELKGVSSFFLDIAKRSSVLDFIKLHRPEVVIHTAAISNADLCEENREIAEKTNLEGTRYIAEAVEEIKAKLVFCSTDLVFDGKKGFYKETDQVNPLNYYAETKVKGEESVKETCSHYLITRLSIIYGWSNHMNRGFTDILLESLESKKEVVLFEDQFRSPIHTLNLSEALLEIVGRDIKGFLHLGGRERISRYEFGRRFAGRFNLDEGLIIKGSYEGYGLSAKRPKDCSLDISRAKKILNTPFMDIDEGLSHMRKDFGKN